MSGGAGGWTAPGSTPLPPPVPIPPTMPPYGGIPYGGSPYGGATPVPMPGSPGAPRGGRRPRRFVVGWVLMAAAVVAGVSLTVTAIVRFVGFFADVTTFAADERVSVACAPGRTWQVGPLVASPIGSDRMPVVDDEGWVTTPEAVTVRQADGSELRATETGSVVQTVTVDDHSYEASHQFTCTVSGAAVISATTVPSDGPVPSLAAFRPLQALVDGWQAAAVGAIAGAAVFVTGLVLVITGRRRR